MAWSPSTRFDVRVVSAINLSVKAYIPRWSSLDFSEQLNGVGGGTITMDYNDSFFSEFNTEYGDGSLFDGTHAIQVLREGSVISTFLIEDSEVQRVGYKQEIKIAGRGLGAELEWAVVLPEGYHSGMNVRPVDGEPETLFDREILSYEFLAHCATTSELSATFGTGTILSTQCLTASSNGSINTSGIDGVTDLIIGSVVLVKNQSNTAHNGIYYVYDTGSAGSPWILARDANFYFEEVFCYVGSKTYVMYGSTNKEKVFDITACPSSIDGFGSSAITFSEATTSYTAISLFYALFKEADEGNEIVTKKGPTWGDVRSGYGRGGATKSVNWALSLDSTFNSAEGLTDSKGALPKDGGNVSIGKGRTLKEALETAAEQTECDWYVSPTGVIKIVRKTNSTNTVPFGTDRTSGSSALLLPLPNATSSVTKTSTRDTRSTVFGTNSFLIDVAESPTVFAITGRRESYIENSSDDTKGVTSIATTGLQKISGAKFSVDIDFIETENRQAFIDFNVGDKIIAEYTIGEKSERIISGISLSVDSSLKVSVELTLNEVIPDSVVSLQNQAIYGTSQAQRIKAYLKETRQPVRASSNVPTPIARVSGLSSGVSLSWNNSVTGNASAYDAEVYRTSEMHRIVGKTRTSNVATLTTAETHSIAVGDKITVVGLTGYNTTDATVTAVNLTNKTFSYSNTGDNDAGGLITSETWAEASIPITSITRENGVCVATTSRAHGLSSGNQIIVSSTDNEDEFDVFNKSVLAVPTSTTFTYQTTGPDTGDDIPAATTGKLSVITELHSQRTPSSQTSAVVENLAISGRPYYSRVVPINPIGDPGYPSTPSPFFSSTEAMSVVGGAIKSPNYETGTTGWLISSDGSAEFGNVTVRGTVASSSIVGSSIAIGSTATNSFYVNTSGNIWSGSSSLITSGAYASRSPFYVLSDGTLFARNAVIGGEINASSGTFSGTITATGTISGGTVSGALVSGGVIQGTEIRSSSTLAGSIFGVGTDGNMKVNNIVASANDSGGEAGLMILADGTPKGSVTASNGSIYMYHGSGYGLRLGTASRYLTIVDDGSHVLLGTNQNSLWLGRSSGSSVLDNVVIDRADLVLYGGAGDGSGNDFFSDIPTTTTSTVYYAIWREVNSEARWVIARNTSSIKYKENIESVSSEDALAMVNSLNLKKFTYKRDKHDDDLSYSLKQFDFDFGFIAEEIVDDCPELSAKLWSDEGKEWLKSYKQGIVDISSLDKDLHFEPGAWKDKAVIGVLVGAVQQLSSKIDFLETQIATQ